VAPTPGPGCVRSPAGRFARNVLRSGAGAARCAGEPCEQLLGAVPKAPACGQAADGCLAHGFDEFRLALQGAADDGFRRRAVRVAVEFDVTVEVVDERGRFKAIQSPAVEQALETIGLTALANRPAGILAHGQKQWLEIGMLLVQDAKVMFLDETVAGMSTGEREETGDLLKRIVPDRTIVVIEHDMEFLRRYADFVTVMHSGKVLAEGTVAEIQADQQVQEVYLGTTKEATAHG